MKKIYKILLVEDDPASIKVITYSLTKYNFKVHHAENGKVALELVKKQKFDLIISDILMPIMDGFGFLEHSKQYVQATPIIMQTALGDREKVVKAMSYNVNMFLLKPINSNKLIEKVKETLKINDDDIINKKNFPFKCSIHNLANNGLEIVFSGIPFGDFSEEVYTTIITQKKNPSYLRFFVNHSVYYCENSLDYLDALLYRINKEMGILQEDIHLGGDYFEAVSSEEMAQYKTIAFCKFSEF